MTPKVRHRRASRARPVYRFEVVAKGTPRQRELAAEAVLEWLAGPEDRGSDESDGSES